MTRVRAWICLVTLVAVLGQIESRSMAAEPSVDIGTAAAQGNLEAIKQHLEAGTDVDAKEPPGGGTPLIVAAIFGRVEAAKLLIEKGANVNAGSNDGATALHAAAFFCHTEIVTLLLDKGAEVNAKNIRGETPLDAVAGQWSQELEGIYKWFAENWKLQLDLESIKATRPKIAAILRKHGGKTSDQLKATADAARARAEEAMRDALKVMRDADKLTDEQVEELFNIVFPKDIDPEKSTRQRLMSFGMYFAGLIDSGQVERFDKDMQKVYDVGVAEIERQGGGRERGQAEDQAREGRLREGAARGNDRAVRSRKRAVPGTLKWSVPLGGIVGYCSPAIAKDGTLYIGGGENALHALNPDGTRKWSFAASGAVVSAPAIGKDGTIYIGTHGRRIHAIAADGTEKWSYPVGDKIDFSSPAIGKDGTIYVGCYDDHLYAMNPDGTKKWSFRAEFNIFSSPAVGQDGTIYVASENGKLYAVNPEDGTQKWSFQTGQYIHASPSIAKDGTVYIGSSDKNLYAIDPKDGSEKWRFTAKDQVHAPPAIGEDGTLYVGSNDGNFYALNPDGTKKWNFRTGKRVDNCSAAIGKDGTVYFGSDDNHIYALNPGGTEKWRFEMNGVDDMDSSPAIGDDGTIYVASRDGNLYAINGESGGLARSPWPMFGLDPHHTGRARPGGYSPPLMKLIGKGEYEMGNHSTNPSRDKLNKFALPVHTVDIDAFWMDVYELTNQKYCEYLNSAHGQGLIEVSDGIVHKVGDSEPYCDTYESSPNSRIHWDGRIFTVTKGKEDHPMVEVSWYGAVAFANWKSAKAGLTPCYNLETWECNFDAEGFRLPTEAEWEKAARGGEHDPYYDWPWGNSKDGSNANYYMSGDPFDFDMPGTTPVGYYDGGQTPSGEDTANGYGLYDMAGNVAEWCNDWYDKRYYSVSPKDNPRGPESGTTRVCRCGSWGYAWSTAMRIGMLLPDYRGSNNGFRLVRAENVESHQTTAIVPDGGTIGDKTTVTHVGIDGARGERIVSSSGAVQGKISNEVDFTVESGEPLSIEMAEIPAGEYEMGDHYSKDRPYWKGNQWAPVHKVYIDAFWMDKYEITNEEYVAYLNSAYSQGMIEVSNGVVRKTGDTENYCTTSGVPGEYRPFVQLHWDGNVFTITEGWEKKPMVQVTWYGAAAYANWKSVEAGLAPCYDLRTWTCNFDADGFRLPTEAEWEKASRGGHHNPYYMFSWGSNSLKNNEGNFVGSGDPFEEEIPPTTPVGYYDTPNGYGLYDMAGNVWEWCNDWWDFDYPSESPYNNPRGPEKGIIHVNRGGGFHSRAMVNSRNATRCNGCHGLNNPASGNILGFNTGFRLVSKKTPTDVDYEAVGKRLRAAVAAGELTGEQARSMMGALRRTAQQGERGERRITREDYARAEARLDQAVAEGRISPEDARARLQGMREMMADRGGGGRARYEDFERRIKAAISEGKMPPRKAANSSRPTGSVWAKRSKRLDADQGPGCARDRVLEHVWRYTIF